MKTMKTFVPLMLGLLLCVSVQAQNKFLPGPDADLQTLPTGSYVIAMDNALQTNTAGNFNLKTYGLITYLLNNNVKLNWVIRAGKAKNGIDFSASAEQIRPTLTANASRDFKAGPFVIKAADTTGVAALITLFYTTAVLTGNNRPRVYRLASAATNVDIRHDMSGFRPKVAILDDGRNTAIHVNYMTMCSIPTSNYTTAYSGVDLLTKCFTFASEPHNDASLPATISAIKRFVQYGGNFLAQCAAVEAYENSPQGHFHTSAGMDVTNSNTAAASVVYPNPDLSYTQFEGVFNVNKTGSVKNWRLASGSSFINNEHNHATGGTTIGASVSKLTSAALSGGLVFYLGNHTFTDATDIEDINGVRMYMNAMLTPNAININCNTGTPLPFPLPVKLVAFNANLSQDQSRVDLTWITAQESNSSHFVVERSTDGINFNEAGTVFSYGNSSVEKNYQLADNISSVTATIIYYRLRQVDIDGKAEYSATRMVKIGKSSENTISIQTYPNPVSNQLQITIPANWQNRKVVYEIVNVYGQAAMRIESANSSQTETLNISSLKSGFYIVKVTCEGKTAQQKIVKQ